MLVGDVDCTVPLFDTIRIHAISAVEKALREGPHTGE